MGRGVEQTVLQHDWKKYVAIGGNCSHHTSHDQLCDSHIFTSSCWINKNYDQWKIKGMSNAEQLFCVFPELGILYSWYLSCGLQI